MLRVKTKNVLNKELIELLGDSIICPECENIVYLPYTCLNCEINICKACIIDKDNCKKCFKGKLIFFPRILKKFLKHLLIKCSNNYCDQIKSYDEIEEHEKYCKSNQLDICNGIGTLEQNNSSFMKSFEKIEESLNIEENKSDTEFTEVNEVELFSNPKEREGFISKDCCAQNDKNILTLPTIEMCKENSKNFQFENSASKEKTEVINKLTERVQNLENFCNLLLIKINQITENGPQLNLGNTKKIFNNEKPPISVNQNFINFKQIKRNLNFKMCSLCKQITSMTNSCLKCNVETCLKCNHICKKCFKINCIICVTCKICKKTNECNECKLSCSQCIRNENSFCSECLSTCFRCEKSFCKRCCGFQCKDCEKICCNICSWNCKICLKIFCNQTESSPCKNCGVRTCINCLKFCKNCENKICTSCILKCETCYHDTCKRCRIKTNTNTNINIICKFCINIKN